MLNFGHTLGHAIEKIAGFGRVLHGEAVALGMVYALELAVGCGALRLPMPARAGVAAAAGAAGGAREGLGVAGAAGGDGAG